MPRVDYRAGVMPDPLSLLPLAVAAAGGRLDGCEAAALVAAGHTLLQRTAPLVRALTGRRSAILLPPGPAFLVALAASDGRGALWLDPASSRVDLERQVRDAGVGAVFSVSTLLSRRPTDLPIVWLDDVPRAAHLDVGDVSRPVDLGNHFGLSLEGERGAVGRSEECLLEWPPGAPAPTGHTHRTLLDAARQIVADRKLTPLHVTAWTGSTPSLDSLVGRCLAPLLAGGTVVTA